MAKKRMSKSRRQHLNRVKKLAVFSGLTALLLATSTYAWFTGLQDVNVSPFEVEIAAADSLELSLNGKDWSSTLTFTKDDFSTKTYDTNSYNWPSDGLFPVSTVGKLDENSSRMIMYEKSSLTTTPGGYRLMANQVENLEGAREGSKENSQDGFVAFDLFIKNYSGTQYYEENNVNNEEAIYLDYTSAVNIAESGVADSGIQNSVRVAFAQIGRVSAYTTTTGEITGLTCKGDTDGATGICRDATIWEPNDTKHVAPAIKYYENSCKERTGDTVTDTDSYTANACGEVKDGTAYSTYAIKDKIEYTDNVDVYDGEDFNNYKKSTFDAASNTGGKLVDYKYFTDTDKNKKGVLRPSFMTLAPNSITKVRVYIYIEGQDIDNYDYAAVGKQISVAFGFTKQRFTTEDMGLTNGELYDNLPTSVKPTSVR